MDMNFRGQTAMERVVQKLGGYTQLAKYKRTGLASPSLRRRIVEVEVVVVRGGVY
jgi:hypothetical protein